jgi:hypothetical protein
MNEPLVRADFVFRDGPLTVVIICAMKFWLARWRPLNSVVVLAMKPRLWQRHMKRGSQPIVLHEQRIVFEIFVEIKCLQP